MLRAPRLRPAVCLKLADRSVSGWSCRAASVIRVSTEWSSRPNDERFLSLPELYAAVRARAERATALSTLTRGRSCSLWSFNREAVELISATGGEAKLLPRG